MSQIISIILGLNLCFAAGIIILIVHGMYFSKKDNQPDTDMLYDRQNTESPKNQYLVVSSSEILFALPNKLKNEIGLSTLQSKPISSLL